MSTDRSAVARLCAPGTSSPNALSTVVVDWERIGKVERQACSRDSIGTDTQISNDTTDDLCRIRSSTDAKTRIICRINPVGDSTAGEIELAIANGADEVLLPMVRSERDVQIALDLANGRIEVGAFIETESAVTKASRIGALPSPGSTLDSWTSVLRVARGQSSKPCRTEPSNGFVTWSGARSGLVV
jgi:hypothetical protein